MGYTLNNSGATRKTQFGGNPGSALAGSVDGSLNGYSIGPIEGVGRWPANLLFDEDAAAVLDEQTGNIQSRPSVTENGGGGKIFRTRKGQGKKANGGYSDSGGASRFFYCAKANTKEREYGCESLPRKSAGEATDREDGSDGLNSPRAGANRTGGAQNYHPTVKPLKVTEWLARLILPPNPGGLLLVPYCGSGSEIIGALRAGWENVLGIKLDEGYISIAHARIPANVEGVEVIK